MERERESGRCVEKKKGEKRGRDHILFQLGRQVADVEMELPSWKTAVVQTAAEWQTRRVHGPGPARSVSRAALLILVQVLGWAWRLVACAFLVISGAVVHAPTSLPDAVALSWCQWLVLGRGGVVVVVRGGRGR